MAGWTWGETSNAARMFLHICFILFSYVLRRPNILLCQMQEESERTDGDAILPQAEGIAPVGSASAWFRLA